MIMKQTTPLDEYANPNSDTCPAIDEPVNAHFLCPDVDPPGQLIQ